jgi:hypothetical protein
MLSSMIPPIRATTRDPTYDGREVNGGPSLKRVPDIRAFVPVLTNPLEVEVDGRPEDVGDPGTIVLLRLKEPLGIFEHDQRTEWGAVCHSV